MKPVYQTDITKTTGNCFSACVASILEVPVEKVPNFLASGNMKEGVEKWFSERGLYFLTVGPPPGREPEFPVHYIVIGWASHKKEFKHSVIGYRNKIVHDPTPKGEGLSKANIEERVYGFLVIADIGKFKKWLKDV